MHGNRVRRLVAIEKAVRESLFVAYTQVESWYRSEKIAEDELNSCLDRLEQVEAGLNVVRDALKREERFTAPKHYLR